MASRRRRERQLQIEEPYNPLDKRYLGKSVADALVEREPCALPPEEPFVGAGVYAIYYTGGHPLYEPIAARNRNGLALRRKPGPPSQRPGHGLRGRIPEGSPVELPVHNGIRRGLGEGVHGLAPRSPA